MSEKDLGIGMCTENAEILGGNSRTDGISLKISFNLLDLERPLGRGTESSKDVGWLQMA